MNGTYRCQEVVAIPVPSAEQLHAVALVPGPSIAVSERRVDGEDGDRRSQESNGSRLADGGIVFQAKYAESVADEVVGLTQRHDSEVQCWKIMMQK